MIRQLGRTRRKWISVARAAPGSPHSGQAKPAKDKNRIKDDIDDGAHALGKHGVEGVAAGLQHPLENQLGVDAKGENTDNREVIHTILKDQRVLCLYRKKRLDQENTHK